MTAVVKAHYAPDLMTLATQGALMGAMERFFAKRLVHAWPAAFDRKKHGQAVSLDEVEIIVLSPDRIGAPAGGSGAQVFFAYYFHREGCKNRLRPSPPVVIKLGSKDKLREEQRFKRHWPKLGSAIEAHFAFPHYLDEEDHTFSVLIAPFQSQYTPDADTLRHDIKLVDLWHHLYSIDEVNPDVNSPDWTVIGRYIKQALETMDHVHNKGMEHYIRKDVNYANEYKWYLRGTFALPGGAGAAGRAHIPQLIFGNASEVRAFGREWPNPVHLIKELLGSKNKFNNIAVGPVHGDLHPKNIVVGYGDSVQIIDFGWAARARVPIVVDYLLLDINVRSTTLPSQLGQADIAAIATFLDPNQDPSTLHELLRPRAKLIKEKIWKPLKSKGIVKDWHNEYLIPFFIVAFGLLVHLDAARNQPAMVASVLAAAERIKRGRT
jgi:hypothetical protein